MNILVILGLLIIVSSTALYYCIIFNDLQHYKTRIELSENSIDENLRKKYDLICELNIDIKKLDNDKDYLKDYIDVKDVRHTNFDFDRKLIETITFIHELQQDHSELNNKNFNKILKEIKLIDENLIASKNFYNKNTSFLNELVRCFPNNIVARNHNFKIKPFFDNKNMQDIVIDDFKL
ncbi:MAG: LemA family protein [bacterium]